MHTNLKTGEAGVGQTAVVEGFALRVAQGDVSLHPQQVAVRTLNLGLLQAGAGIKGKVTEVGDFVCHIAQTRRTSPCRL